jgi:hypothetical protein
MAIQVQVEGAWLLVSGADAGELWEGLHRVLSVGATRDGEAWCVVIGRAGAEELRVFVEDEDAACALAAEVRGAVDRVHELRVA